MTPGTQGFVRITRDGQTKRVLATVVAVQPSGRLTLRIKGYALLGSREPGAFEVEVLPAWHFATGADLDALHASVNGPGRIPGEPDADLRRRTLPLAGLAEWTQESMAEHQRAFRVLHLGEVADG